MAQTEPACRAVGHEFAAFILTAIRARVRKRRSKRLETLISPKCLSVIGLQGALEPSHRCLAARKTRMKTTDLRLILGVTLPVMFCPQCRVCYRAGFTHCTDCDVDLVDELPLARAGLFGSNPGEEEDPFCAFWQGDDARLHVELSTVLDEAGIPHKTVRREDHLFNLKTFPAFQIGVPFSLFEKAETAVKDAYEMDVSGADAVRSLNAPALLPDRPSILQKLPETLTPSREENIPGPPQAEDEADDDAEWQLEGRGIEVWFGEDTSLGDMLVASLRENKIRVRRETSHGGQSLLVSSEEEAKAREIVKEVVEGVPPE